MKILQLCSKTPVPPKDGGSLAVLNMAVDLSRLGHEVTILAVNTPKHRISPDQIPVNLKNSISFHFAEIDTRIRKRNMIKNLLFSQYPYIAERFISENFNQKLTALLKEKKFDIIQFESPYLSYYLPTVRNHSEAVISYRAHNLEHEIWKRKAKHEVNPFYKLYFLILAQRIKKLEKHFINRYDILVPITQRDLHIFNNMGNIKPAYVAPFGINIEKIQKEHVAPTFPSLFYLGSLDWLPNQEGIIWFIKNVWPTIRKKYPTLECHAAGRNAPENIVRLFKQSGIIFHGEVESSSEFISRWAIMISPVFSGSGMRVKIAEGMALGKAIVTTTIGTEGINTTHEKNILIADTSDRFVEYISRLIENKEWFDTISRNAVTFAKQHFDNKQIVSGLIQFYADVLH